ncbi:hypothetical protein FDB30_03700 [Clostridium botulinum]|uniref:hypothetical protein n=1 Tax=Clostridium botulinum TaxID=1491 RepID=UPI0007745AE8|nr:hypothetical protein [Clostridium botulinum]MBN1071164.1 hypothetical protein [Clostridium botulinum]MBY7025195.1 hypothetical protein [Clostridium botulinum]NFE83354.1 hypothetical protein [Clostridium botulinum]NFG36788.1 hypothetical protein [Clostridium botulinum]NFN27414.1 hypothetical protein [Clostridium botulinum]
MKFSKEKFLKNAEREIKKRLSKHLDIVNGMEVEFYGEFEEIKEYTVDGQLFCLYPIYKTWCEVKI